MLSISTATSGGLNQSLTNLRRANTLFEEASLQLTTGRRINHGSDDPVGLIAAEVLRADLVDLEQSRRAHSNAASIAAAANRGLSTASSLVTEVRGLLIASAGSMASATERQANQRQIDATLDALDAIGHTTYYGGAALLDGSARLPSLDADAKEVVLPTVSSAVLGDGMHSLDTLRSGGEFDVGSGNLSAALAVVSATSSQLYEAQAGVGAYAKYSIDKLTGLFEARATASSTALSLILDADTATSTARMLRGQILMEASIAAVGAYSRRDELVAQLARHVGISTR